MSVVRRAIRRFLRSQSGAVTVEYVVLAAAITGVALASSDVINNGLGSLSGTIEDELSGEPVGTHSGPLTYDDGFDNGSAGWSGATVAEIRGVGKVLGPIPGSGGTQAITRDFQIDPGAGAATFSFDVLALDSLDNESGIIFIDGREVGRVTSTHGRTTFTPGAGLPIGTTIEAQIIDNDTDLGGISNNAGWRDSRTKVTVSVAKNAEKPVDKITFGFGSNANQGVDDESFAIDNFKATGLKDPGRTS